MWCLGGFVVLSASPDKALGTALKEEEMSGFTANLLPVLRGPMWTRVICPPWTLQHYYHTVPLRYFLKKLAFSRGDFL